MILLIRLPESPSDLARVSTSVTQLLRFFQKEEHTGAKALHDSQLPQVEEKALFEIEFCGLARPRLTLQILP